MSVARGGFRGDRVQVVATDAPASPQVGGDTRRLAEDGGADRDDTEFDGGVELDGFEHCSGSAAPAITCSSLGYYMYKTRPMSQARMRRQWRTLLDLANAIFDYVEIIYNRQRRHSQLDHISPTEYELCFENPSIPA